MPVYNTTFRVDDAVHDSFLIWIRESYIPEVQEHRTLRAPHICRILNHRNDESPYSLQQEAESDRLLHRWYMEQEVRLDNKPTKIFKDKAVSFPILTEIVE